MLVAGCWLLVFLLTSNQSRVLGTSSIQQATATVDTNQGLIGDWFQLTLKVAHDSSIRVSWPIIGDTVGKLEVIKRSKIETQTPDLSQGLMVIKKQFITLTAYDSGSYLIPPFNFQYHQADGSIDSVYTSQQMITIFSVKTDTTQPIKDIKAPLKLPFTWEEALPYIIGGAILIALAYLIYYWIKRRKKKTVVIPPKKIKPAHIITLEKLKRLEEAKLWHQGKVKLYYIRLSDIIREYIENRFEVLAMESTTEEILEMLEDLSIAKKIKEKLYQLLTLADLVKFAKAKPLPLEHENSLQNAYAFVKDTPVQEVEEKEEVQV